MRGTVLEATDGTIYLCVGTSDGAKAGQELTVVRFVKTGKPWSERTVNVQKGRSGQGKNSGNS